MYLGFAHGLCGIVNSLLLYRDKSSFTSRQSISLDTTIATLSDIVVRCRGRLPSHPHSNATALSSTNTTTLIDELSRRDTELVQLCHGAPGFIAAMCRANRMDAAKLCVDDVFERGLDCF